MTVPASTVTAPTRTSSASSRQPAPPGRTRRQQRPAGPLVMGDQIQVIGEQPGPGQGGNGGARVTSGAGHRGGIILHISRRGCGQSGPLRGGDGRQRAGDDGGDLLGGGVRVVPVPDFYVAVLINDHLGSPAGPVQGR